MERPWEPIGIIGKPRKDLGEPIEIIGTTTWGRAKYGKTSVMAGKVVSWGNNDQGGNIGAAIEADLASGVTSLWTKDSTETSELYVKNRSHRAKPLAFKNVFRIASEYSL